MGDRDSAGSSSTTLKLVAPGTERSSTSTSMRAVDLGAEQGVLVAAGDIACAPGQGPTPGTCQMGATAQLVASLAPDVVAPLGDLQYEIGTLERFTQGYDRTWGALKGKTKPAVGNHEYANGGAPGYFGYFGAAAGDPREGWYSYDIGSWHAIVLNSNCRSVGGCGEGSPQLAWLRADLAAAHRARCIVSYWHHPRYSSGLHGGDEGYEPFWAALHEAGAELALAGHDHHYERFAPQGPGAQADPRGVRQFVVGTGGRSLYPVIGADPNSEERNASVFGALELRLHERGYRWTFRSTNKPEYTDEGSATCT